MGFNMRQCVYTVLAAGVAVALYFLLKPYLGTETLSWVCILGAFPFVLMGFVNYNKMNAEQLLKAWFRSRILTPGKLKYESNNFVYKALEDDIKAQRKGAKKRLDKKTKEEKRES